jgi:PHP family Zn ribbon phosphoesterase
MYAICDLQIHSRFSRAVSKSMTPEFIAGWAVRKGISVIATGDWTHPIWFREIERDLEESGNGLLRLKGRHEAELPQFLLATEVSCIYTQAGRGRRIHILIWVSSLDSARKISMEMTKRGCNLLSDGRPIIPLTAIQVAELVFSIDPHALVIPAHAWTPWFSLYGSMSGFDSITEAFGEYADHIYGIETGLSSSPAMNWRIKELDNRRILSFSDAHSGPKLGREATVFETHDGANALTYEHIYQAIRGDQGREPARPISGIAYTIEFFPEEGKYHFSGHRACNIRQDPETSGKKGMTCPVCGKPLTQGVMQRVSELAGRSEESLRLETVMKSAYQNTPVRIPMTGSATFPARAPYVMLVPLVEILSECIGSPVTGKKVESAYQSLTTRFGGEFGVLLKAGIDEIRAASNERISQAIDKVRHADIVVDPGYDGVFGVVKIWKDGEVKPLVDATKEQLSMF